MLKFHINDFYLCLMARMIDIWNKYRFFSLILSIIADKFSLFLFSFGTSSIIRDYIPVVMISKLADSPKLDIAKKNLHAFMDEIIYIIQHFGLNHILKLFSGHQEALGLTWNWVHHLLRPLEDQHYWNVIILFLLICYTR